MEVFTDRVTAGIERALDGVAERQRVTAHNIANVNTPGYRARRVSFEDQLAAAFDRGRPSTAPITVHPAGTPVGLNDNNVSLEAETIEMIRSELQYQALVEALRYKLRTLGTAIRG